MIRMLALAGALAMTAPAMAQNRYSGVYVFGDSLVDAGNVQILTGGRAPAPNQGYFQGRFTNGPDYTDFLSKNITGNYTTPSLAGGTNYAYGGARSGPGALVPNLAAQVKSFTDKGAADPRALYVINMGGNDVFALGSSSTGGLTTTQYTGAVVQGFVTALSELNKAGARNILIAGLPFEAGTPGVAGLQTAINAGLAGVPLAQGTTLFRFDFAPLYARLRADPASFGLGPNPNYSNATPCITQRPLVNGTRNCYGYFFFDSVHPSAPVQRAFFREVAGIVGVSSAVPEPQTWAMMIVGFGLVGAAMRRRRAAPSPVTA